MAYKFVVFAACIALAKAGQPALLGTAYSAAPVVSHVYNSYGLSNLNDQHALGLSQQNILRTHGGTVSQISKQVVSPHSSVSKSVTSVTNDGYKTLAYAQPSYAAYAAQPIHQTYAAPIAHQTYAAPIAHQTYAAPIAHQTYAAPIAHQTYAAPITHQTYAAPIAHQTYAAPIAHTAYAAPKLIAQPAIHTSYAAPIAHHGLVAAAAPLAVGHGTVAHVSYASPISSYGW